jgi:hypothetical protein
MAAMQVATGTVVNGKVVIEGDPLPEGAVVAVVARGADEPFTLSDEDEAELQAAVAELERGESVPADEFLETLRRHG